MRLFIASVICRCSPRSCRDYSRPPGARMSDHWSLISTDAQHDRTQGADGSRAVSRILSFIDFLLRCPPGGSPDPPARQAARDERSDNALGPLMPSLAMQAPVPAKLARACSLGALAASTDPRAAAATYPAALLRHHPGVALKPRPRARHCLRRRHCIPTPSQSPVPGPVPATEPTPVALVLRIRAPVPNRLPPSPIRSIPNCFLDSPRPDYRAGVEHTASAPRMGATGDGQVVPVLESAVARRPLSRRAVASRRSSGSDV
jgi:hypothetical protein